MLSILLLCKQTAKCSQFFRLFCSFFLLAICMQHMVCLQQSHICTNYYYVTSLLIDIFWDQVDPSHWSKYYSSLKMYAHGKASTKTKDAPIERIILYHVIYYIFQNYGQYIHCMYNTDKDADEYKRFTAFALL